MTLKLDVFPLPHHTLAVLQKLSVPCPTSMYPTSFLAAQAQPVVFEFGFDLDFYNFYSRSLWSGNAGLI